MLIVQSVLPDDDRGIDTRRVDGSRALPPLDRSADLVGVGNWVISTVTISPGEASRASPLGI
jgi:hypothetical protein